MPQDVGNRSNLMRIRNAGMNELASEVEESAQLVRQVTRNRMNDPSPMKEEVLRRREALEHVATIGRVGGRQRDQG